MAGVSQPVSIEGRAPAGANRIFHGPDAKNRGGVVAVLLGTERRPAWVGVLLADGEEWDR